MSENVDSKSIVINTLWKLMERVLTQLITFIVSVSLARVLEPTDYGAIAMALVFIALADVFVFSGIPNALIQKKDADSIDFSSVFIFNLFLSIIIYILLFISAPAIAGFYDMEVLTPVIRVMGIRIIIAGLNSVQHAYVSRNMMFKKYFVSTMFGTVISGALGIYMAYNGYGVWAIVVQYMTNTFIDSLVLWFTVKWRPQIVFSWLRIKALFKFGWKLLFEGIADTINVQVRNLIIGKVYSSDDLAFYNRGTQLPYLISDNICGAIGAVLFPAVSKVQDDKEAVKRLLREASKLSAFVVFPMLFGLAAAAKPLVIVLFKEKWVDCVPFVQIFCVNALVRVTLHSRHQALLGVGRSDVFMLEHMITRVIGLVLLLCTFRISVMAIAISGIIGAVIMFVTVVITSKIINNYSYKEQLFDLGPVFIGCIIMYAAVSLINLLNWNYIIKLICQVVVGIVVYVLYSLAFNKNEIKTIIKLGRMVIKKK